MKSGNLNFLEPSGSLQACNGTALPLPLLINIYSQLTQNFNQPMNTIPLNNGGAVPYRAHLEYFRRTSCTLHCHGASGTDLFFDFNTRWLSVNSTGTVYSDLKGMYARRRDTLEMRRTRDSKSILSRPSLSQLSYFN